MKATAHERGDDWIIRRVETVEKSQTTGGQISVGGRAEYWDGNTWVDDPRLAVSFASKANVSKYLVKHDEKLQK